MDQKTRESLEQLYELTNTPGWAVLAEDLDKKVEAIKEELTVPSKEVDGELLRIAQGRILAYRDILSIHGAVGYALKQADEEAEEDLTE